MDPKRQRFTELSWKILEYKAVYYQAHKVHKSWKKKLTIPDAEYDNLESEYRELARELELEPTAADAVGFPADKWSGKLVMKKLERAPRRKRRTK